VEAEASNTLNNFDLGDTRTTHAVVSCSDVSPTVSSGAPFSKTGNERVEAEAFIVQASELRLRGQITEQSICPTLTAGAKQGDTDPLAVHAISFQPGNLARKAGADPSAETFPTLTKDSGDQSPHVAYPVVPLDGMNLLSRLGECGENHSMQNFEPGDPSFTLKKGGSQHGVLTPMAVRRLTPVECERLQGFPDNWSRISWKGKPAEECPDGPRYKACGNSMAVPVMRFIGEAIAAYEAKQKQG
jgi:DNA (cytosine-5)-methyltransferase 1